LQNWLSKLFYNLKLYELLPLRALLVCKVSYIAILDQTKAYRALRKRCNCEAKVRSELLVASSYLLHILLIY